MGSMSLAPPAAFDSPSADPQVALIDLAQWLTAWAGTVRWVSGPAEGAVSIIVSSDGLLTQRLKTPTLSMSGEVHLYHGIVAVEVRAKCPVIIPRGETVRVLSGGRRIGQCVEVLWEGRTLRVAACDLSEVGQGLPDRTM